MNTNTGSIDLKKLILIVLVRLVLVFAILGSMFFLSAGTFHYWEAWLYLAVLVLLVSSVIAYFLRTDPELIERRMRVKEKEPEQKTIIRVGIALFVAVFLLPGFDERYGWSSVPLSVVLAADVAVVIGYLLFIRVLKENRYASRTIEVEKGQTVVATGPYAVVRHPMYVAALFMYIFSPLALGSYWALMASTLFIPILIVRILDEEKVLCRDLEGYTDYIRRTRYRLIPGIW